jgi:hypothetical protein
MFVLSTAVFQDPKHNRRYYTTKPQFIAIVLTMLLRIDVYPSKFQVSSNDPPQSLTLLPPPPTPPVYTCLASPSVKRRNDAAGVLVSVGRGAAQCDIVFDQDKSVSREHVLLRLISKHSEHQQALREKDNNVLIHAAMAPRNDQERMACQDNDLGMCVVLENLGKFGSLVVVPKQPAAAAKEKVGKSNNDNDDETDDDDDDHAAMIIKSQSQIAQAVLQPRQEDIEWKRLGPNESAVLYELSSSTNNNHHNNTITTAVQIGQNGATLVITRIPMRMAWSGVPTDIMELWNPRLYGMGATFIAKDEENASSMTHLITSDGLPTAKLLMAWSCHKPIVSVEYLQAMLSLSSHRTQMTDPLPDATQFLPTALTEQGWWKRSPHPNAKLWSYTTVLSACPTNPMLEQLVQHGAGAHVISLYDNMPVAKALKVIQQVVDERPLDSCVAMNPPSNAKSKIMQLWKKLHVPVLTFKQIAKLMTEQEPLTKNGKVPPTTSSGQDNETGKAGGASVVKPASTANDDDEDAPKPQPSSSRKTTTAKGKAAANSKKGQDDDPSVKTPLSRPSRNTKSEKEDDDDAKTSISSKVPPPAAATPLKQARASRSATVASTPQELSSAKVVEQQQQDEAKDEEDDMMVEAPVALPKATNDAARRNDEVADAKGDGSLEKSKQKAVHMSKEKKDKDNSKSRTSSQTKHDDDEPEPKAKNDKSASIRTRHAGDSADDADSVRSSSNTKTSSKATSQSDGKRLEAIVEETKPTRKRSNNDDEDDDTIRPSDKKDEHCEGGSKKRKLVLREGWFTAAPTKERKASRQSYEQAAKEDGIPAITAVTEARNDLIVLPQSLSTTTTTSAGVSSNTSNKTTLDYKKFRKNFVMRGRPDALVVELRSVLPKETPLLRELEEQQLVLEQVQRKADALFHDGKATKKTATTTKITNIRRGSGGRRGRGSRTAARDEDDDELDI